MYEVMLVLVNSELCSENKNYIFLTTSKMQINLR